MCSFIRLAAQTNTQLLHVLCDLVQAFIDTEKQIEVSLTKLGFSEENISSSQADSDVLSSLEDMIMDNRQTGIGQSHQAKLTSHHNKGHHPHQTVTDPANGDFCDDGPDLINPSSFILAPESLPHDLLNADSGLKIDDDIVLGYSKRLRTAVDRILHLLKNVASLQQYEPPALTSSGKDQHSGGRLISKSASMPTCSAPAAACDHQQEVQRLQSELREATRMMQILQEEVNKKHNALSALRAQIETQSILDAKSLKQENEALAGKLMLAERKIQRQAEMINQLQSDSTRFADNCCAVIELTPEKGRRDPHFSPPDVNLNDNNSLPFDKSEDLLNLDELQSLSSEKGDDDDEVDNELLIHTSQDKGQSRLLSIRTADGDGDGDHRTHPLVTDQRFEQRESLYQQIIQEKDEEIEVLKNQMRLAQNMIANAFPDQKIDEYLDMDLIETLVDTHLKNRLHKKDTSLNSVPSAKNRFSGVDLIEPIQDMRESNGQDSPKSFSSGGHVATDPVSSHMTIQVMDAKISQLQSVIEKMIAKNTQVQMELDNFKSQNELLNRDLDQLRNQKAIRDQKFMDKERELIELKLSLEAKEDELTSALKDQEKTASLVDVLKRRMRVLVEEITSKENRIHLLSQRIEDMDAKLQHTVSEMEQVRKNNQMLMSLESGRKEQVRVERELMSAIVNQRMEMEQLKKDEQDMGLFVKCGLLAQRMNEMKRLTDELVDQMKQKQRQKDQRRQAARRKAEKELRSSDNWSSRGTADEESTGRMGDADDELCVAQAEKNFGMDWSFMNIDSILSPLRDRPPPS